MSTVRKLYRREAEEIGGKAGIMGVLCWVAAGVVVYMVPPEQWWIELGVLFLLWLGGWWIGSFITKRRRWGLWGATVILILAVLQRWGFLNWITFGLWLVLSGILFIRT